MNAGEAALAAPYDGGVTVWWWFAAGAVVLIVAVTALTVGLVVGIRASRHDAAPDESTSAAARAFDAAPAGQIVVTPDGAVLLANRVAREFGMISGDGELHPRIAERIVECTTRSESDDADQWETPGLRGRTEVLSMTARNLGGGLVLATATDETASRTAELIRRDFVANVSHELKSPVTAIGLLAEAVLEASDSPATVTAFAQRMQRESARLGTLINEIIALSAIQGGGLHEVGTVRVDDVVRDAVDRATVSASAAGIAIRVTGASGATVTGDRNLLTTAVGNLVDNAVHYSESGSVVTVTQVVRRGIVDIAVADRGIGIAPRDQRRVFERFFRADPARSRATGGTGLGLAIVKHVAANHRGSIRLASKVGVGSTFTLRLPLAGTAASPLLISEIDIAGTDIGAHTNGASDSRTSPDPTVDTTAQEAR
jgi:two-component system sensor histidine kinase SenX3